MHAPRLVPTLLSAIAFVVAVAVAPVVSAQGSGAGVIPRPRSTAFTGSSSSFSTPSLGTPWGTRVEHWLVAGAAIALGAATVAVGTGMQRYAVDLNAQAIASTTTQHDAASLGSTARDFLLVAEVLWSVGASLAAIGLTWVIVLTFSTPAPTTAPDAPVVPPAATAALRVTPLGLTLEGTF